MKEILEFKEDLLRINRLVEGWLSDDEKKLLFSLARNYKGNGDIVEIGSWKGRSTICLAKGLNNNKRVYAIDPHKGNNGDKNTKDKTYSDFILNIRRFKVEDKIIPIVDYSINASKRFSKESIGLIFIDGSHKYRDVKNDLKVWFDKIEEGGIVAMHDTVLKKGPRSVADKYIYRSNHFKDIRLIGSITYARRSSHISFLDHIKNRKLLLIKTIKATILKWKY